MSVERVLIGVALILGLVGGYLIARSRRGGRRSERPQAVHQILLPFTGTAISRRAVDAALRLAQAEDATLMPAYLATVSKRLPLDCAIPAEAAKAMPMLEAIEQRAAGAGCPRRRAHRARAAPTATPWSGCSDRESFDRVVVPATAEAGAGFSGDDLVWLLEKAPAEVLILRPGPDDRRFVTAKNGNHAA